MVARAGFPPVVLQPVSFEQLYMQRRQAASGGQAGATQ
jgi:preprotein translocase subunit SecB